MYLMPGWVQLELQIDICVLPQRRNEPSSLTEPKNLELFIFAKFF